MTAPLFKGVITALITPLRDGKVDEAAFTQLRGAMKSAGVIAREPSFADCVDHAIVTRALGK